MVITGTKITAVEPKKASNGNTFYIVHLANGTTASTFDQQAAIEAREAIGKVADVTIEEKFKGEKSFRDYLGFTPALTASTPLVAPAGKFPTAPPAGKFPTAPYKRDEAEKNERIGRMNAATTAFAFIGQLIQTGHEKSDEELIEQSFSLARRIYRFTSDLIPDSSAEGVAAEVNAAFGSEAVQVGAEVAGSERQW